MLKRVLYINLAKKHLTKTKSDSNISFFFACFSNGIEIIKLISFGREKKKNSVSSVKMLIEVASGYQ